MSKIKVNEIENRTGTTLTVGGGACKTAVVDATTVTLGRSGATVSLAPGATQSGFGRAGAVNWCSTIYTNSPGTVTATSGKGFFLNTTSGGITINLPSSPSVGDIVAIKDYANTFDNNTVTVGRNGSKIAGACADGLLATEGQSVTLIYADSTRGWLNVNTDSTVEAPAFITATGGVITTDGNYKVHTFNGDGCFAVTAGTSAPNNEVSYLVVAGGGGAPYQQGGGGGAGGFREDRASNDSYSVSPLDGAGAITVSTQTYPITVGGGGAGGTPGNSNTSAPGGVSTFSTITSAGGGNGAPSGPHPGGGPGGSGGGAGENVAAPGSNGNQPPVNPAQGNPGGSGSIGGPNQGSAGGGGGAGAAGGNIGSKSPNSKGGDGGVGVSTSISGSSLAYAGGGGGGGYPTAGQPGGSASPCGTGGAGGAHPAGNGANGTTNRGGAGGSGAWPTATGGTGGSGVVIIRYKFQS